ncbi:MAG: ribosome maturation factor RimP [Alkalibacterium sp.]|uniref:Ribosome maturation factor RimP n=1 Tax=Alkalibacterium gilvum TaxID=1130080 RepID=A0A1H6QZR8_9LACT|nr:MULTISPECIES: ribosome maturation factor RimP [Alkalibacterium]MDN6193499.1 ribosome maturation factor RimP [Alkalibacterium sp.]MDN6293084.1 ribosome maturation factor RimP [Alkalibacterium sp.]MDN6294743.1 ribosome maturation factor RimP [Alkalibacterium sp.]MDN6326390.1 ribosome maturation factor RimP [Alkalibacterium sp.]MDN6397651.1 ribosome maturation factor RimP [Alkalibacterium sp.]
MNTVEKVREISRPIASELGYELVDVDYLKEGKNWFLRLYIDKPEGVDLDDCALFSEKIGERLDAVEPDPIPHAYYLEVSSPGAEKPLRTEEDLKNAVGEYIHVKLHGEIKGNDAYDGTLKEWHEDYIVITIKDKTKLKDLEIEKKHIAKARLAIEF